VNYKDGFIGTGLKKEEFAFDCSDMDNIIVFRRDGKMVVSKVADKFFAGKDIIHLAVFQKSDERTTYNMVYLDGKTGIAYGKRFNVTGITRDKEYDLTKGNPNSRVIYFSANPNGEAEIITMTLSPGCKARSKQFDYPFEELDIKSRGAGGNQVTKYPIKSVRFKEKGRSTLDAIRIFYDDTIGRLNKDGVGIALGRFEEKDRIIAFYKEGTYEITDFELTNRYEPESVLLIEKFNPEKIVTAVYFDAKSKQYNVKRFRIETQTLKNKYNFVREGEGNFLELVTTRPEPIVIVIVKTGKKKSELQEETIALHETIDITGWKTIGTFLAGEDLKELSLYEDPDDQNPEVTAPTLF
jgi:topoisomerase-4 subunit A